MSIAPCPLCDRVPTGGQPAASGAGEWPQRRCDECELLYADPLEHPGGRWYEESPHYADRDPAAGPALGAKPASEPGPESSDWRFERFFDLFPEPGRVLDVGCGDGAFLQIAASAGWRTTGVDVDPRAIRRASEGRGLPRVHVGDVEAGLPGIEEGFDVVAAFDLVEHVADPLGLLRGMVARLGPGGAVVVTVPRWDRYPAVFDEVVDRPPHHLTLWTEGSLRRLLTSAGLASVRVEPRPLVVHDLLNAYVWRRRRSAAGFSKDAAYFARNAMGRVAVATARALGVARGHTLLAVGRRCAPALS